ncbi:MAG: response regulator, partial [Verrucomicrobia bacterium]|nr:response regulator [Verrucomicrobiota bacterium]
AVSGEAPDPAREARALPDQFSTFLFEIQDTGPGIPAAIRQKLFEPFTQGTEGRRKGGTGLGLAIARRHIELMGGTLELESETGKGARFYFSLPLPPALGKLTAPAESASRGAVRLRAGTRVRALVADDVPENRDILRRLLEDLGVDVTVREDGEQALKELRAASYAIAFLDIRMPGKTGFQVATQFLDKSKVGRAKLVAISASVLQHEQSLYEEAGFDAFVPKPFQFEEICECLERLLGVTFEYEAAAGGRADLPAQPKPSEGGPVRRPSAAEPAETDFDPSLAERCPLRILLADDYEENQKLGARLLRGFGYECALAGNGVAVIRALEREPFDLVLLDVNMPEMDGFEAARQIRERWRDRERPWVVALTASVARVDREECLEAGMDDYLSKPVEIGEVRRVLEEAGRFREYKTRKRDRDESPIDWKRLKRMLGDDTRTLRQFLDAYLEKTSSLLTQIRAARDAGDAAKVEFLAHRCKGSSANFGIRAMVEPMERLEEAGQTNAMTEFPHLLEAAERAFEEVRKAVPGD